MDWKDACTSVFIAALFTMAKKWKQPKCLWMDKEDVVHKYNEMILSHYKEWNNVICSNMDGPRDCHAEWSHTEKEKYHIISYN